MNDLPIVFMGTPDFAVPSLQALVALGTSGSLPLRVVCVITQPDRPAGRGGHVQESPVKRAALDLDLQVWQPERLRRKENVAHLANLEPALIVVAAFAQILSPAVLEIPRHGCLNVHASLLPRYRGASPISAALLAGETTVGVTIMKMDAGLDTGDILTTATLPVEPEETTGSLTPRLAILGADLLARTVPQWIQGELIPQPQNDAEATLTRLLRKEDGLIDWTQPAMQIERASRAYAPWPGTYTYWEDRLLKILKVRPLEGRASPGLVLDESASRATLNMRGGPAPLVVGTGAGLLEILTVQPEGRRAMAAADFAAGHRGLRGAVLGGKAEQSPTSVETISTAGDV